MCEAGLSIVAGAETFGRQQQLPIHLPAWLHGQRVQAGDVGLQPELVRRFVLPCASATSDAAME